MQTKIREKHFEKKQVLRDVTFSVKEGEWFGIFGQNGAGKSTLLQILCRNLRQQEGEVRLFGKRAEGSGADFLGYGKMVLLPQDPKALFTEITVKEELMEALEQVVGMETLAQFEDILTQREAQNNK